MVNIKQNICPSSKWSIKCPYAMTPEFIVTHNTANDASAANEIAYMNRNNDYTSYHFAVDDVEIVQGLPLDRNGWHAGDGANGAGNRKGIGIEICYSKSGGDRFDQAERNAAWLTAKLLKERGWGIDRVKKHQDFMNKYCPHRTLDNGWRRYLNMVQVELNKLNQPAPSKPANADIAYEVLPKPRTVVLTKNTTLWNFNFTKWGEAKAIKNYNQGEKIEVVAIAHNKSVGGKYYMTDYSWNNGNIRATNGFNTKDCQDYVASAPTSPKPETKPAQPKVEPPKEAPLAPDNPHTSQPQETNTETEKPSLSNSGEMSKEKLKLPTETIEDLIEKGLKTMENYKDIAEEAASGFDFSDKTKKIVYLIGDAIILGGVITPMLIATITAPDMVVFSTALSQLLVTTGTGLLFAFKLLKKKS